MAARSRSRAGRSRSLKDYQIAKLGLGLVPEGRQIFPNLTVRENLIATAANRTGTANPWEVDHIVAMFPNLGNRMNNMGNQLSGGEQQMLAVGRALMTNPKLLILDEATEGLAPLIREEIWKCLEGLKERGQSILGDRQERGRTYPHRRPPLYRRTRPDRLGRQLCRAQFQ